LFSARGAVYPVFAWLGLIERQWKTFAIRDLVEPAGSRLCFKFVYILLVRVPGNIWL